MNLENIKGIITINCKHIGKASGTWVGKAILFKNNIILGLAYDSTNTEFSHVITGDFVPKCGIMLIKSNKNNFEKNPIGFSAFANDNGKENRYYGDHIAISPIQQYPMGESVMKITIEHTDEKIVNLIEKELQQYRENVKRADKFQFHIFENTFREYETMEADEDMQFHIRYSHALNREKEINPELLDDDSISHDML